MGRRLDAEMIEVCCRTECGVKAGREQDGSGESCCTGIDSVHRGRRCNMNMLGRAPGILCRHSFGGPNGYLLLAARVVVSADESSEDSRLM
jgi:hypothetical protein